MRSESDDLRREAREIASGGKGARQAWAQLRQWASGRGPAARKCAMMEFLGAYGGTPEAAFVMPEIMRSASQVFTPSERTELVRLSSARTRPADARPLIGAMGPKHSLPMASTRPALALSFRPSAREGPAPRLGAIEPITPSSDPAYLRDMPIRMRERLGAPVLRPPAPRGRDGRPADGAAKFDSGRSPDSMQLGAHKGEHIVRSLISSLRSHGRDEPPHLSPARAPEPGHGQRVPAKRARKRKQGKKARPAPRKRAAPKAARRRAKTAARKAGRRPDRKRRRK